MLGPILIIIAYILVICEFIWYFTCTEHKDIPLIIILLLLLLSLIPGVNLVMCVINITIFIGMVLGDYIKLKNNWFNRVFLAHYE